MVCSPAKSHKPSLNRKMVFNCYAPQLSFSMVQALHTGFSFSSLSFQMGHSYVSHSPYPVNEDRLFPSFAISNSLFPPLHSRLCILCLGNCILSQNIFFEKFISCIAISTRQSELTRSKERNYTSLEFRRPDIPG